MRRYRCHKIVEAGRINRIVIDEVDGVNVTLDNGAEGKEFIHLSNEVFARGRPGTGDYLVRYEDGYVSWSPKDAFEDGYTLLQTADEDMPMAEAQL